MVALMADYAVVLVHSGPTSLDSLGWSYHGDDLPLVGDIVDLVLATSHNIDAIGATCQARVTAVDPDRDPPISAYS
jgi:hypothetical protein